MSSAQKLAIVTGGNTGLGYHAAKTILASSGWSVIIACRVPATAQEAVSTLKASIPANLSTSNTVDWMQLDLASLDSIRNFVQAFAAKKVSLPPLHALVLNAGIQVQNHSTTKDGFETTFGVNHLGHFLLAQLMLPHIAKNSKITFVASGTHDPKQTTGMPHPVYTSGTGRFSIFLISNILQHIFFHFYISHGNIYLF